MPELKIAAANTSVPTTCTRTFIPSTNYRDTDTQNRVSVHTRHSGRSNPRRMKGQVKLAIDREIECKFGEKQRATGALLHDR